MNATARISLLLGALVLLVFGIVCLKQQLAPGPTPPAFVPPGSSEPDGGLSGFSGHQPTILSAEPSGEHDLNASPRLREVSPIPVDEPQSTPIDYPINTTLPAIPREFTPIQQDADGTVPSGRSVPGSRSVPGTDGAAFLSEPEEISYAVAGLQFSATSPTMVTTALGDSLWTISERVYGRGEFYKALFLHNRAMLPRPDRIAAGIQLKTPSLDELRQLFPDACPPAADSPAATRGG